jgi:DNA mismatch endonuclease (patch repair protein)
MPRSGIIPQIMVDTLTPEERSARMARIGAKNTVPELAVRRIAHALGYRFRLHRKDLPGRPDLVFPRHTKVVFVHGCFWHGHDCGKGRLPKSNVAFWESKISRNRERDARVVTDLEQGGWSVLIVWQCQTKDPKTIQTALTRFLLHSGGKKAIVLDTKNR